MDKKTIIKTIILLIGFTGVVLIVPKINDRVESYKFEKASELAKIEAERLAKIEAEMAPQREAERLAKIEAERLAKIEAEKEAKRKAEIEAKKTNKELLFDSSFCKSLKRYGNYMNMQLYIIALDCIRIEIGKKDIELNEIERDELKQSLSRLSGVPSDTWETYTSSITVNELKSWSPTKKGNMFNGFIRDYMKNKYKKSQ